MTTPRLSICILTFNRARTLRETLHSILPQVADNPEVEVVISDNASTDDTASVCRDFQSRYPAIRYCPNPENLGVDGNIVACVEKARGEYVSFFSDDDLSPPGAFPAILEYLRRLAPSILCINHIPFLHNDPSNLMRPMAPVTEKLFADGKKFFLFAGLGFLSSLTLRSDCARKYIGNVVRGRGTAHLDMAVRIALSDKGPFLYAGNLMVLGRYEYNARYDILTYGPINVTKLYLELEQEKLLSAEDMRRLIRRFILHTLPQSVAINRCRRDGFVPASALRELYGKDPLFYLYVYPLSLMPPPVVRGFCALFRPVLRSFRRFRHGR